MPIKRETYIYSGNNTISLVFQADYVEVSATINNSFSLDSQAESINLGSIVPITFEESIDWDNVETTWNYNAFLWYVVDEDASFVYFVITDSDGQFKLPATGSGEYLAQMKSNGSINTIEPGENEHITKLAQCYDNIVVGNVEIANSTVLHNGDNTTIRVQNMHDFYRSIQDDFVGVDRKLTNFTLPDGIYNIDGVVIDDSSYIASFVIIDRIWHLLYSIYGDINRPVKILSPANPVSSMTEGGLAKIRSVNFEGIWCDDAPYDDELSIEMLQSWLQSQLPASMIGQPIEVSDSGSAFNYQFAAYPETFDMN